MIIFGSSLPSALGWLVATKVYSGPGADIVMESIALTTPKSAGHTSQVLLRQRTGTRERLFKQFAAAWEAVCRGAVESLCLTARFEVIIYLRLEINDGCNNPPVYSKDTSWASPTGSACSQPS